jgi:hypothetical protein
LFSSWDVLEAAPARVRVEFWSEDSTSHGSTALQTLSVALHHGALKNLQDVYLWKCGLHDGDVVNFMDALEASGGAKRMEALIFEDSGVGAEGLCALADPLCRDTIPVLKELRIPHNEGITDVGVMALAEGLLKATHTFLTCLDLTNVGMADPGLTALASLVHQGRLEQLKSLRFHTNGAVTDLGIVGLARAIDAGGLPMLETLDLGGMETDPMTVVGISAIAHATIKGCPQVKELNLSSQGAKKDMMCRVVKGMLHAAGREAKVKVTIF